MFVPYPLGTTLQKQLEGKRRHNGRMGPGLLAWTRNCLSPLFLLDHCPVSSWVEGPSVFGKKGAGSVFLQGLYGFSKERREAGPPEAGQVLSGGKNSSCRRQPSYSSSSVTGLQGQLRSLERLLFKCILWCLHCPVLTASSPRGSPVGCLLAPSLLLPASSSHFPSSVLSPSPALVIFSFSSPFPFFSFSPSPPLSQIPPLSPPPVSSLQSIHSHTLPDNRPHSLVDAHRELGVLVCTARFTRAVLASAILVLGPLPIHHGSKTMLIVLGALPHGHCGHAS